MSRILDDELVDLERDAYDLNKRIPLVSLQELEASTVDAMQDEDAEDAQLSHEERTWNEHCRRFAGVVREAMKCARGGYEFAGGKPEELMFSISELYTPDVYGEEAPDILKAMPYPEYLQTRHWQRLRKLVLTRAEHRCQLCNAGKTVLHIHHRGYAGRGEESMRDLVALCDKCHATFHGK